MRYKSKKMKAKERSILITMLIAGFAFGVINVNANDGLTRLGAVPLTIKIDKRMLKVPFDSIDEHEGGILTLVTPEFDHIPDVPVEFKVVIRHYVKKEIVGISSYDERYMDGKIFTEIEIKDILKNAKIGDQILLIPIDTKDRFSNAKSPFILAVADMGC